MGCEFSFHAIEDEDGGWTLKHRQGAKFNRHNHGPTKVLVVHHQYRRLHSDALTQATTLIATRLEAKDIVVALLKTLDIPLL
jgi:hypothetical protein